MAVLYNDAANSLRRLKFLSLNASFEEVQGLAREIKDRYDKCIAVRNVGQFLLPISMEDKTALMVLEKEGPSFSDTKDELLLLNAPWVIRARWREIQRSVRKFKTMKSIHHDTQF